MTRNVEGTGEASGLRRGQVVITSLSGEVQFDSAKRDEFTVVGHGDTEALDFIHPSRRHEIRTNHLTGLPIEDDLVRQGLTRKFSDAVVRPWEEWAFLTSDVDNLKGLNEDPRFGRPAGNYAIVQAVNRLEDAIGELELSKQAKYYLVQSSDASDEVYAWFFGLTPDDLAKVKTLIERVKNEEVFINSTPQTLSQSLGMVASDMEYDIEEREKTIKLWKQGTLGGPFYDYYNNVKDRGSEIATREKKAKQLGKLPLEEILEPQNISEFRDLLMGAFSQEERGDKALFSLIYELGATKAHITLNPEGFRRLLEEMGISKEELKTRLKTAEPREKVLILHEIYVDLMGSSEDSFSANVNPQA